MYDLWCMGITVRHDDEGWIAECQWTGLKDKNICVEGIIATHRYCDTLPEAIDYVLECMKYMNVQRCNEHERIKRAAQFALYQDEENEHNPEVLRQIKEEAAKRGWECYIPEGNVSGGGN